MPALNSSATTTRSMSISISQPNLGSSLPQPPGSGPIPLPASTNFWTATRAEGLTTECGTFNQNLYTNSDLSKVKESDSVNTWVNMTNKSFGVKNDFYFGSGSDRLILADTTKRTGLNDESIFMGNGNDDLTHTGTLSGMFVALGNDHDRIVAKSARQLVVDLVGGNDILNIRQLEGDNRFIGGRGNDIFRLKDFNGDNVIEDTSGVSTLDFTDTLRDKSGQVITSQGYPIKCKGGKWAFTTDEGRNSGTKATPGQAGPSVNSFNFTKGDTKGGYKLIDKEGDALQMNFGAVLGNKLSFVDGSIQQNPKTGVWTKTVINKSAKTEVVTTYQLNDKGEWKTPPPATAVPAKVKATS